MIDLSRLRATQTAMVSVFPTALDVAGGWPSARLVLFGADATLRSMLKSTRVPDTVPLADDLVAALALLRRQPPRVRRYRDLPMHRVAPAAARGFVRETCTAWSVPQETEELAELVANELVTKAVQHAQSSSRVTSPAVGQPCASPSGTTSPHLFPGRNQSTSPHLVDAGCIWWPLWPIPGEQTSIPTENRLGQAGIPRGQ